MMSDRSQQRSLRQKRGGQPWFEAEQPRHLQDTGGDLYSMWASEDNKGSIGINETPMHTLAEESNGYYYLLRTIYDRITLPI